MTTASQASEVLRQYLVKGANGEGDSLLVPEGKYKGWVPRSLFDMKLECLSLPFLRLLSFPVGGTSFGQLVSMQRFNIVGNYLSRLPNSFCLCQNLVQLNLSYNYFTTIPSPIFQLVRLVELDFNENDIDDISSDIGKLVRLRVLNLSGNLLSDLPAELADCKHLERLDLSRKWYPKGGFTVLPKAVCFLTQLSYLDVSWHQIHTIPDEVSKMSQLQTLKMKGNFLKHVSKNIIDCKQLKYLDLTGAMKLNSCIPAEIFLLSNLQILDLTNNYFTEISSEVVGLKNLKKFIMRRNALLRLPKELFTLNCLEYLDLSESYLEEIPSCLSDLKMLKGLYLCHNKIQSLPDEICNCENLLELQLHKNELEYLPDQLYKLRKLEELTLDNNKLKRLPLMLDKLVRLQETGRISLTNNLLTVPPQAICDQGINSLYEFLKELRICEAKHRRKMILIGASQAGKTSLRNALVLGRSKLTAEHERTWVMERHLWEPEPDLRIQILDFGGHHIYSAAHHMFLTPEALHLVVFDVSKYHPDLYDDLVGNWIEAITDRAPGASIMLVCTHSDLVSKEEIKEKIQDVLDKMHTEEDGKLDGLKMELKRLESELQSSAVRESGERFSDVAVERMRDKVNYLRRILTTRVTLPNSIYVVSCAEELSGVHELQLDLFSTLRDSEERPLPQSWYKFLTLLQEQKVKILTWSQTLAIFERTMKNMNQSMYMLQGSPKESMAMVLKYLHVTGEILWYQDNPELSQIVFHRPETLVEMLRTIFRHDYNEMIKYQESLGQLAGLTQRKFETQKEEFLHHGLMTQEMLHYTLLFCDLSIDAREMFIDLMLRFDLCYEIPQPVSSPALIGAKRILQFPWFLTADPPADLSQKWPDDVPPENIVICFQLQFPRKEPPNFFEKVSARLQSYIFSREDWKDGILASRNKSKLLLERDNANGIAYVTLYVRGSELQELWFLVRNCRREMLILLKEWPFVRFDASIVCSHCILTKREEPHMWPGEVVDITCPRDIYHIKCPSQDQLIPACFVYPLDEEFQDDLGEHIKAVQEFLQGIGDTVDSAGHLLSDLGLADVAARLGAEWHLVALHLDLTQAEIERIQMDMPAQTLNQIRKALITWFSRCNNMDDHDKVLKLMNAIEAAKRNDLVFELKEKYHIEVLNALLRGLNYDQIGTPYFHLEERLRKRTKFCSSYLPLLLGTSIITSSLFS